MDQSEQKWWKKNLIQLNSLPFKLLATTSVTEVQPVWRRCLVSFSWTLLLCIVQTLISYLVMAVNINGIYTNNGKEKKKFIMKKKSGVVLQL